MSAEEQKKVEEKPVEEKPTEEVDDDEPPSLESVEEAAQPEAEEDQKQTRAEKKVRKAMQKLGLKAVPEIMRVTIRRDKNYLYYIANPEVYRTSSGESYVCFGRIQFEDLSATQAALQQNLKSQESAAAAAAAAAAPAAEEEKKEEEKKEETTEEAVDETGLNKGDIELVMSQAKCTRAKAAEALRKNNGDIVSSVMELSQ